MKKLDADGINIIKTDNKKKLVIDGLSNDYEIYKIKLDKLYYNEKNDRIATWMTEHSSNYPKEKLSVTNNAEHYNSIIQKFIEESNKVSIKTTYKNIELVGQQEPGVVLCDGRVIDGNRRFTCLRKLQESSGETQYFLAIILPHNYKDNEKEIKKLELSIQYGTDEKIAYNVIDKLVGMYLHIVQNKILTIKEYADSVGLSEKEVSADVDRAKIMAEFLEFINAPEQFHLIRDLNLADPIKELIGILKKIKTDDESEQVKYNAFGQFLVQPVGEMTRHMRDIKKISESKYNEDFIKEQTVITEEFLEKLNDYPIINDDIISEFKNDDQLKGKYLRTTTIYKEKTNSVLTKEQPVTAIDRAITNISSINQDIFAKLSVVEKRNIGEKLLELDEIISKMQGNLDV